MKKTLADVWEAYQSLTIARGKRDPIVLTADGVVSLIGCLMGNPFINAVYIGHPGWKAMGGRIGYSAATGLMVLILSWFGILAPAGTPAVATSTVSSNKWAIAFSS